MRIGLTTKQEVLWCKDDCNVDCLRKVLDMEGQASVRRLQA